MGVEYAGMLLVAALIVTLVMAPFVNNSTLGRHVAQIVCSIFTLGQGSCDGPGSDEASRIPVEPCTVASDGYAVSADVAVTFVTGGGNAAVTIEELSNGQYRVSVTEGASGGVTAGIGIGGTVTINDGRYGAEADASASATIDGAVTETYIVNSREAAEGIRDWAIYDQSMNLASNIGGPGSQFVSWLTRPLADWGAGLVGLEPPGSPDSVSYQGGASAEASATVTALVTGAQAEAAGTVVRGVEVHADGTQTVYGSMAGSIGIEGSFLQAGADATAAGQVGFARTMDAEGNMVSVTYSLMSPTDDGYAVENYTLPIRTEADRAVADQFLYDPRPWVWSNFQDAALARGEATQLEYDTGGLTVGASGTISLAAELGAGAEFSLPTTSVTSAQYYDGSTWQPWAQCGG